ncbi:MAG: PilZ domain-containing protein [Thermodesulfobacteriota bacterium]
MTDNSEKRIFRRLMFPPDEIIGATLSLSSYSEEIIKATILNISEGGLGLKFNLRETGIIHEGDHLKLETLIGMDPLKILEGVEAEIRWVLHHKSIRGVRAGCRFINLAETKLAAIREYISNLMDEKIRKQDEEF